MVASFARPSLSVQKQIGTRGERERAAGGERWGGPKRRTLTHTQTRAAHVCEHAQAERRGDHFSHPSHTL